MTMSVVVFTLSSIKLIDCWKAVWYSTILEAGSHGWTVQLRLW